MGFLDCILGESQNLNDVIESGFRKSINENVITESIAMLSYDMEDMRNNSRSEYEYLQNMQYAIGLARLIGTSILEGMLMFFEDTKMFPKIGKNQLLNMVKQEIIANKSRQQILESGFNDYPNANVDMVTESKYWLTKLTINYYLLLDIFTKLDLYYNDKQQKEIYLSGKKSIVCIIKTINSYSDEKMHLIMQGKFVPVV